MFSRLPVPSIHGYAALRYATLHTHNLQRTLLYTSTTHHVVIIHHFLFSHHFYFHPYSLIVHIHMYSHSNPCISPHPIHPPNRVLLSPYPPPSIHTSPLPSASLPAPNTHPSPVRIALPYLTLPYLTIPHRTLPYLTAALPAIPPSRTLQTFSPPPSPCRPSQPRIGLAHPHCPAKLRRVVRHLVRSLVPVDVEG